ncbi:MAG: DoxX family membrane protein [Tidjanibacter sp.]|nr:DoxX family membrane protein [Tidjanibacter sp.]
MKTYLASSKWIALLLRIAVGVVFVFSGVVKAADPYGTVLKIGEYLHALGIEWLGPLSGAMCVALVSVEVALGVALVVGAWPRVVLPVVVAFNLFYTALTLWLAVGNPIGDCGCFGDVVVLTNWQTFWKNVALLGGSAVSWAVLGRGNGTKWGNVCAIVAFMATVAFALYNLLCLPLVEKFPFGEGVDLRALVMGEQEAQQSEVGRVVCRNVVTGEVEHFDVNDPTWWDESVWNFLEMEGSEAAEDRVAVTGRDFVLTDEQGDMTADIVEFEGTTVLLCVQLTERVSPREWERIANVISEAHGRGERVVVVTATEIAEATEELARMGVDVMGVEVVNLDITTLQVVVRAPIGVVWLRDGVIEKKIRL